MLEQMAAACRCVASDAKLRVLYELTRQGELRGSGLAEDAGLTPDGLSHHARRLSALGLIERRRAGAAVFWGWAAPARGDFATGLVGLVRRAFSDPDWASVGWDERRAVHLRPDTVAHVGQRIAPALDVVFDAATAFGNVRRLQLVRLILRSGPCRAERIAGEFRMSHEACERHTDKLRRRGVIKRSAKGWEMSKTSRTPFHKGLTALVARRLRGMGQS